MVSAANILVKQSEHPARTESRITSEDTALGQDATSATVPGYTYAELERGGCV